MPRMSAEFNTYCACAKPLSPDPGSIMPETPRMKAESAAGPMMKPPRSFCRWTSRVRRAAISRSVASIVGTSGTPPGSISIARASRASLESPLEFADLSRERTANAEGEPAQPHEEDGRDEHVGRVDPARDVRGEPPRWRQGRRERPREVADDREEGAEDDRKGPRSHRFATDSHHSYRGIGYTSSPPSHF